jgi:hypothetical protein
MYAGTKITIGDEVYEVPALSLGMLRNGTLDLLKEHDLIFQEPGRWFDAVDIRAKVILACIRRNYPDFSEEKLMDWLDLKNIAALWSVIMGASGFTLGEAPAANEGANGTSDPSTPASPPLTAGPSATSTS